MVITTKQPRQSMPAAPSRTASSTATAKTAKRASLNVKPATSIPPRPLQDTLPDIDIPPAVRAPPSNITLGSKFDATGPFADDAKFNPSPKKMTKRVVKRPLPKRPSKAYKKKKARQWSELIELLTKTTVLLLCIYSVLVCPKDAQLQSPVCRGLDHYRRTIVDPYILPPLRAFVAHPAVAPQIERARPYVEQAVETVKTQYHIANDKVAVAASPYILMARQQYAVRFRPHVKLMEYNLRRYHKRVQPYINLARRKAIQKWIQAQPYIDPVLVKLQQAPVLVKTFIQQPLEHGKERWVDPQVKKIMDKVHEMGVAATTVGQEGPDSIKQKPIVPEPVPEEMLATPQHFVDQTPTTYYSSPAPESTSTQSTPSESTTTATMEPIDEPTPTEDPRDKPLYNPNYHDDVEDIEFWEQFEEWLSESILTTDPPATSTTSSLRPAPTKLTDEEKAERDRKEKEETAIKRKEIVGRHEKWEKELEALIESETNALVKTISNIRKKMSEELSVKETIQEQLKKMRDELSEGKKYAKVPLDRYKEDWEDRYGSFDENIGDKIPQWLNILESLDRNFERRVESVNKDLAEWVPMWVKQESEAIKNAGDKITSFADKAQADLIGDYAWLWDVTHRDWDRYHQLMFRGRDAKQKLQDLANGAIESALTNPVKTQLAKMKEEMTKLHHEYFTEINKIRQQGWKYLLGDAWSEEAAQKYMDRNDASKFGTEPDKIGVPKPKSPLDREVSLEDLASNPIIGKDKEQVAQAMEAMEAERAKHEEL